MKLCQVICQVIAWTDRQTDKQHGGGLKVFTSQHDQIFYFATSRKGQKENVKENVKSITHIMWETGHFIAKSGEWKFCSPERTIRFWQSKAILTFVSFLCLLHKIWKCLVVRYGQQWQGRLEGRDSFLLSNVKLETKENPGISTWCAIKHL